MTITAEAHTDDHAVAICFDAEDWFIQAEDSDILRLAECEWGGDYPADAVADYYAETALDKLFTYISFRQQYSIKPTVGFECHVSASDAIAWVKLNRPLLFSILGD
jgi:hypothetical protein